jgi:hypothetical protein
MNKKKRERLLAERKRLLAEMDKRGLGKGTSDLTDPDVYRKICEEYSNEIGPKIDAIDSARARSIERDFAKIIG